MLGGLLKQLPVAVRDSFDKVRGSMLLSMAKGMTASDADTMARHWGYLPPPQSTIVPDASKGKEAKAKISVQTFIPERPATQAVESVLQSMHKAANSQPAAMQTFEVVAGDVLVAATVVAPVVPAQVPEVKQEVKAVDVVHPIFGRKIIDLGYKTVYLTSVSLLARTQVWERQRTLRPERAARIAASKVALGRTGSLSGVITMFCDKATGQSGIVDGQHRAGALMLLAQQGHWDGLERNILIDVFETETDEEIVALFKEINSAEPVRLVDMPGEGASVAVKDILDSTIEELCTEHPEMFKASLRCKPPHLHESILRDDIFQSDVITRRNMASPADLKKLIDAANDNYSKLSDADWEKLLLETKVFKTSGKALTDAVKKARQTRFFLGLDSSWMHAP